MLGTVRVARPSGSDFARFFYIQFPAHVIDLPNGTDGVTVVSAGDPVAVTGWRFATLDQGIIEFECADPIQIDSVVTVDFDVADIEWASDPGTLINGPRNMPYTLPIDAGPGMALSFGRPGTSDIFFWFGRPVVSWPTPEEVTIEDPQVFIGGVDAGITTLIHGNADEVPTLQTTCTTASGSGIILEGGAEAQPSTCSFDLGHA